MQEIGADALGQYQGEDHDGGGLDERHEADPEHLAREQLNGAHSSQEHLYHPAGLLLHDPDQDPGVVLREHHEYENEPDQRRGVRSSPGWPRLEAVNRERPLASQLQGLRWGEMGRLDRLDHTEIFGDSEHKLGRRRGVC